MVKHCGTHGFTRQESRPNPRPPEEIGLIQLRLPRRSNTHKKGIIIRGHRLFIKVGRHSCHEQLNPILENTCFWV